MGLQPGNTIDALRNTRPCCLMCIRTEHYPHKLSGPEAQPRWKCPQRSGLLTWFALLTMPSATFFARVAPLLAGNLPAGVLVSRPSLNPVASISSVGRTLTLRLRLCLPSQVASALTYLTATLMMALTAFSDPGTVPPATSATRRAPSSPSEVLVRWRDRVRARVREARPQLGQRGRGGGEAEV